MERRYLIDTNVVLRLGQETLLDSSFFIQRCHLVDEVIDELGPGLDWEMVRYPITVRVLEYLTLVMASIPPGNVSLVDLYRNEGRADPVIIAAALNALEEDRGTLMGEIQEWAVASEDQAVRQTCAEFGIPTVGLAEMRQLVTRPTEERSGEATVAESEM